MLEEEYPDAWWMPGSPPQLIVATGALRRLPGVGWTRSSPTRRARPGPARWLLRLSGALAAELPRVPLCAHFCEQTHRLVELSADDTASGAEAT
ncbi:M56 family metallopeptidase OS=Streptomyces tendae OX=1932 GN=F3L20_02925 PE=3 SV=1 [Streptomyces tendae]